MKRMSMCVAVLAAFLIGGVCVPQALGAIACGAVGEVTEGVNGTFVYTVTVTWDFNGAALPEEINLILPTLVDCEFYTPGNPLQTKYVIPLTGVSQAQPGCYDVTGLPTSQIQWVGAMRFEDQYCWIDGTHVEYTNSGATVNCLPLSADSGVFTFSSYGAPLPTATYYDAIVIKAGADCIVCDYEGPMPDCNLWAPVKTMGWGTIKALYR